MKWPWNRPEPTPKDVMDRLERLESAWREVQLEWANVYDKVSAALARLRKRDRDAEAAPPTPTADDALAATGTHPKAHLYRLAGLVKKGTNGLPR